MRKRRILALLMVLLALAMAGCGAEDTPETTAAAQTEGAPQPLGLTAWSMNATTWSSPNGATVNLTATPSAYTEGQSAVFSVRMEGDEVAAVPCDWDGSVYTASAELNAADGYCYYVVLTAVDGAVTEVGVNVPNAPTDESLINLADALDSHCDVAVTDSSYENGKLTVTEGTVHVRLPRITLAEGKVTCQQANLVLSYNGEDVALEKLELPAADDSSLCQADIAGVSFSVPTNIEDDHQLSMRLDVQLSNGHSLTAAGGNWYYLDGQLLLAVG